MGSAPLSVSVRPALRWVVGNPVRVTSATSNKCAVDLVTDGICVRVGGISGGEADPPRLGLSGSWGAGLQWGASNFSDSPAAVKAWLPSPPGPQPPPASVPAPRLQAAR